MTKYFNLFEKTQMECIYGTLSNFASYTLVTNC